MAIATMAAQLLLGSPGYAQGGPSPRFYAQPGIRVGPFWIGEAYGLGRLGAVADDELRL